MNSLKLIEIVGKADKDYALAMVPADTLEKFAELIVRECAKVAGKYIHENKYTENGVSDFWLTETIKDHFGVEE